MKTTEVELNDNLQIEILDDPNPLAYPSRVDDILEDRFLIAWPTHRGVRVPFHTGQELRVSFLRKDAVYSFQATVEEKMQRPLPRLVLHPSDQPQRLQRRSYFRVQVHWLIELVATAPSATASSATAAPSADPNAETLVARFKAHTHDLSGSGLSVRHASAIPIGSVFETRLIVPEELPALNLLCEVVRNEALGPDTGYIVGLRYLSITERQRSRIILHLTRAQRKGTSPGALIAFRGQDLAVINFLELQP